MSLDSKHPLFYICCHRQQSNSAVISVSGKKEHGSSPEDVMYIKKSVQNPGVKYKKQLFEL